MGLGFSKYQVGVIGALGDFPGKVVLVTNRSGDRWIFPKGRTEKGRSDRAVAIEEAFEEAGLLGELEMGYREIRIDSPKANSLRLYRMRVTSVLKEWPEKYLRKRIIVSIARAEQLLKGELSECLRVDVSAVG